MDTTTSIVRRLLRENESLVMQMEDAIEKRDDRRVIMIRKELDNNERQQEKWRGR